MNKKLLITLVLLLAVMGVAALLYPRLSTGMEPQQMATVSAETTTATEPPATETQPAETTEPAEQKRFAMPDFTVLDWDGNEVQFSDYAGKPVVLNFWAHWCDICRMELPGLNEAYERLDGEVTFLLVHGGAAVDKGKEVVTEGGYTFPVVFDVDSSVSDMFGITGYPTTFFIDADGYLTAYWIGNMGTELLQQGLDMIYTEQ